MSDFDVRSPLMALVSCSFTSMVVAQEGAAAIWTSPYQWEHSCVEVSEHFCPLVFKLDPETSSFHPFFASHGFRRARFPPAISADIIPRRSHMAPK